jgi:nucleoid DNA-binding protein
VVPTIIGEIKTELISELKSVIKSAVIQAIEDVIKPLQDCINKQNEVCITSGFSIVVSSSLHVLKDWSCVLKVTCLSLPGFGTFRVTDCERCR